MEYQDKVCSTSPYFEIPERNLERFKKYCERYIKETAKEPKCLFYGFSFNGNVAHCRESFLDADGVLEHMKNVMKLNIETINMAKIVRFEVHGPKDEIDKLREPLAFLKPTFFELEYEFRRPVVL